MTSGGDEEYTNKQKILTNEEAKQIIEELRGSDESQSIIASN